MAEIIFPKIGFSMTEGTLTEWHVADGTKVEKGQLLYSFESEKSVQDVEAADAGTLKIRSQVGEIYPVGAVIGEIV